MVANVGRGTVGLVLFISALRTIQDDLPVQYLNNTICIKDLFSKESTVAFSITLETIAILPYWIATVGGFPASAIGFRHTALELLDGNKANSAVLTIFIRGEMRE